MVRKPLRSALGRSIADLAIELGDPGRMMRARKLHRAGHVGEIVVESLRLNAPVFGSDNDVYETSVMSDGSGSLAGPTPEFGRMRSECTCPDWGDACKHALALLLTFAEEVEDQPHLVEVFLNEGQAAESDDRPSTLQHPFLTNDGLEGFTVGSVEPIAAETSAQLLFEGTDAWPVLRDAIETMRRALSE
jgi:hypothetical protein